MPARLGLAALVVAVCCATAPNALAAPIDNFLNFATVDQNLWGPGQAITVDESITIPPPSGISASVDAGTFEDPTSAIADFLGIDVGIKLSPTATFDAGLSASFHANSGSIDLNYPEQIQLSLPDTVQAGQAFTVGASLPVQGGVPSIALQASSTVSSVAAIAGAGYEEAGLSAMITPVSGVLTPVAGFTTVFPYAEARVDLDLSVAGSITSEACLIFCFDGPTIDLGSVDLGQQLFELNSLDGLKVLNQTVVPFGTTVPVAEGVSVGFGSPNVTLDGALRSNGDLSDTESTNFLGVSFNVDQLIPVIGQILQSNIGPLGYNLLSVTPTISLGIQQQIVFDPQPMVDLQFQTPVFDNRDGRLKNDVVFAVGDSVSLTPTVGGGGFVPSTTLVAKPTFFLDNVIHNVTNLVLTGSLDVTALEIDTPYQIGPAFHPDPIDLGEIPLLALDDQAWMLSIPSITGAAQTIAKSGIGLQAEQVPFSVDLVGGDDTNDLGHSRYNLFASGNLLGQVYGTIVETGGVGCGSPLISGPDCQQLFVADDDVFGFNQEALGRYFCLFCSDFSPQFLPTSPSLTDVMNGNTLFLSDLTSFDRLIGLDALLDPTNARYDAQLAETQYFANVASTEAHVIPAPTSVDEPEGDLLLLAGLLLIGRGYRRRPTPAS